MYYHRILRRTFTLRFTNYRKAVHYLIHEIPKTDRTVFDDAAAIEKNVTIMELLGKPQNRHPAIHMAGTSGKGTVCYLIDALLRAHSKKTGMTQSPHVYDIRERIQVNGQLISERLFTEQLDRVLTALGEGGVQASYFETLIAMAFNTFAHKSLDYVVIETGFGGRLDATNVMEEEGKICILGQIGFDHTQQLGETLAKIASEKAGIVQQNSIVVALRQSAEVNQVFEDRCRAMNAKLTWVEQAEDYQKTNDRLALAACEAAALRDNWRLDPEICTSVLQQVFIPGRFEKRHFKDHLLILDGAHNPQKLSAFANRLERENKSPVTLILTLGKHKDIKKCLAILKPVVSRIILTEYFTKQQDIPVRPQSAEALAQACEELGIACQIFISPRDALYAAAKYPEPIAATGSFYLIGEIDREMQT
jgi:dihydrofolate synthase/folylpolyglutamate synthase